MRITTNNQPRDVLYPSDLSLCELEEFRYLLPTAMDEEYDNMTDEHKQATWCDIGGRFFRYQSQLYDLGEFVAIQPPGSEGSPFCHYDHLNQLSGWEGVMTDSYFSGLLVKFCNHGDSVVVGWFST